MAGAAPVVVHERFVVQQPLQLKFYPLTRSSTLFSINEATTGDTLFLLKDKSHCCRIYRYFTDAHGNVLATMEVFQGCFQTIPLRRRMIVTGPGFKFEVTAPLCCRY